MAIHYIPKNLKGETRLLRIFSIKSLITTAIFAGIGAIFFLIFSIVNMRVVGVVILVILALIGYAVGTVKIPKVTGLNFTKNIEGDSIDEIFLRYVKFRSNRKIYSYTKEDK